MREELTEEELAIFDLLTKPNPALTKAEEARVKKVVKELLATLKTELLVLDWKKRQATRASVEVAIQDLLDGLPEVYDRTLYARKCSAVSSTFSPRTKAPAAVFMRRPETIDSIGPVASAQENLIWSRP